MSDKPTRLTLTFCAEWYSPNIALPLRESFSLLMTKENDYLEIGWFRVDDPPINAPHLRQFNMAIDEDAKCARCGGTEALWLCPSPREHWSKEYLCEKCGEEIIGAKG